MKETRPMTKPEEFAPIVSYCNAMEEIKARLADIQRVTKGYSPFGRADFDAEAVCLLLRKALETLAFASLMAHREAYTAVFNDVSTLWRAKRLLQRLREVHPEFYPMPVLMGEKNARGVSTFEVITNDFLTHDDFEFLYDKCSEALHTRNPFKAGDRVIDFDRSIYDWTLRISKLLNQHVIRLHGSSDLWLVQMQREDDGKVHAYLCPAVGEGVGQPLPEGPIGDPE